MTIPSTGQGEDAPPEPVDQFAAFRHKSYQRYFSSRFLTALAVQILSVAVSWQIYDQTENPALLGWLGLVQFLPALALVLVTGYAADRFGRRLMMGLAIILLGLCAGLILLMAATRNFEPVWVLVVLTLFGVGRAFHSPASASLAVNLVPKKDFPNAVGWITSSWQMAHVLGPAIGGLLYGISGPLAYAVATSIFLISGGLIFSIPRPAQRLETEPASLSTILGGFRYIWKTKIVLGAISLDLFAVLLGGAVAMMPIYARDILDLGPVGLGLLRAAPGIGAIAVVLYLVKFPIRDHAGKILFICVGLFGLSTVLFGVSKITWVSIAALVLIGAFDMVSVYIREILLQLWTPDEVRGRVNAVNSIFLGASNELGDARAGFMAAKWGAVFTVVSGGIVAIGIAGMWAKLFPGLTKARHLHSGGVA